MRSQAKCYDELRAFIEDVPLIDCHDHSDETAPAPAGPISAVIDWYMRSDLVSASSEREIDFVMDETQPLEVRWPVLQRAWARTHHTGYAQVTRRALRHFYGEDDLSLEALGRLQEKMIDFSDPAVYEDVLDQAGIRVRIEDVWKNADAVRGTLTLPPRSRLAISLPAYHAVCSYGDVQTCTAPLERHVTSLDEYLEACRTIFERCKAAGAVTFKDQSAYSRPLDYGNPPRAEAEAAFNWMLQDPRRKLAYPDGNRALDDYLFQQFMRMARDLDLPVQIHTGHMAGIYNRIPKTNAVQLAALLELHREVRFDLFHANWPYSGELLFLAKNYPNVSIDFCWVHMIDPIYTQNLFKQALSSVPHAKIHGYGSDLGDRQLAQAWAHADLARDNMAIALADLVDMEYIDLDDARELARGWLFDYPNDFFRLGL